MSKAPYHIILLAAVVLGVFVTSQSSFAQDIHFSQSSFAPLTQNPANTGLYEADFRFIGNYRNQWRSVPVPFSTLAASAEYRYFQTEKRAAAGGLSLFWDQAGDSKLTSIQVNIPLSYIQSFTSDSAHFLSVGIMPGFVQKTIDYSALQFDNQFNGDVFDPDLPINESFSTDNFTYFDLAIGGAYFYHPKSNGTIDHLLLGAGVHHITQPKQSFFGNNDITLKPRLTVHGSSRIILSPLYAIWPSAQYQSQDKKEEGVVGVLLERRLFTNPMHPTSILVGGYGRLGDAIIPTVGFIYQGWRVGLSYDINTSALRTASNSRGGVELSVRYLFSTVPDFRKKGKVCPIF